jgi:hypothetical protein
MRGTDKTFRLFFDRSSISVRAAAKTAFDALVGWPD